MMSAPAVSPSGDMAGVFVVVDPQGDFAVAGFAFPKATVEHTSPSMDMFFDAHSHAVIAEHVRSLPEAKRLGEAWLKKFRKGLVLAACACETMTLGPAATTRRSSATRTVPKMPPALARGVAPRGQATLRPWEPWMGRMARKVA